jgi:hypothetical protein
MFPDELEAAFGVARVDHAGRIETSLLWALEPDRRAGEAMAATEAAHLAEQARRLLEEYANITPDHRLRTYADVERVWTVIVLPVVPELFSMRDGGEEWLSVPEGSRWFPNWRVPYDAIR